MGLLDRWTDRRGERSRDGRGRQGPALRLDAEQEDLLEQVSAAFDGAPGVTGLRRDPSAFALLVRRADGEVPVPLDGLLASVRGLSPADRAAAVAALVTAPATTRPAAPAGPGARAAPGAASEPSAARPVVEEPRPVTAPGAPRRGLRPVLAGVASLPGRIGRPSALPLLAELLVAEDDPLTYVDEARAHAWGLDADRALADAWQQLAATGGEVTERRAPDGRRLLEHRPDPWASSRLVQPGWLRGLEQRAGTPLVAAAPAREELWAVPADDPLGLSWLLRTAREAFEAAGRPVSPVAYATGPGGAVVPWQPDPDDPLAVAARTAERLLALHVDAAQRERVGVVADAVLVPLDRVDRPGGEVLTRTAWARDGAQLLPDSDLVELVPDPDVPESSVLVRAADLGEALRRWTTPAEGLLPARRRTTGFPDAATLDALRRRAATP